MGPLAHAAEGEEGAQAERGGRVGIEERIADMDTVDVALEDDFLLQEHAAHAVGPSGHLLPLEADDVLVAFGAVVFSLILVEAEVELSAVLDDGLVERGEKHVVLVVQFGNGDDEQTIVLTDITPYEGC